MCAFINNLILFQISRIKQKLTRNKHLSVCLLFDYLRGTRGLETGNSCLHTVNPLIMETGANDDRIGFYLYHTPDLNGIQKQLTPKRFNEVIGVQHLKIYAFDDTVILSGANLSDNYFDKRQDRYIVFHDHPSLSQYMVGLMDIINSLSFKVSESGIQPPRINPYISPVQFKQDAFLKLSKYIRKWNSEIAKQNQMDNDQSVFKHFLRFVDEPENRKNQSQTTFVYPMIQMAPLGIRQDEKCLEELFEHFSDSERTNEISITSGYFNFTPQYEQMILGKSLSKKISIITASAEANGFFNSRGISKYIPDAYTWIRQNFLQRIDNVDLGQRVKVWEYKRPGWTYHAKGVWAIENSKKHGKLPYITTIGSPNFGYRSCNRDLEAQVVLMTKDLKLRQSLAGELRNLYEYSKIVDKTDIIKAAPANWVRYITRSIKTMM